MAASLWCARATGAHRLGKRTADIVVSDDELEARRAELEQAGGYRTPRARRRGRRSSAASPTSSPTAWC